MALFYEEPDPDRWFIWDRFPRRVIRRVIRGAPKPGGQMRVFLNLCHGLDRLGVSYSINDFRAARANSGIPVGIVGKPHVLDRQPWKNPILFGASVMSHPLADPTLLERYPIRRILVQGVWMQKMCEPYWGNRVKACPVGIDTDRWVPRGNVAPDFDVLVYDKVRWDYDNHQKNLLEPILATLESKGLRVARIRYGFYREEEYLELVRRSRSMIFLCEHETQGFAYQQALSCDVPILAWDRGGYWQDPEYFPDRVKFSPVSSVPNWDDSCGVKFTGRSDFDSCFEEFWRGVEQARFAPRKFILDHLTLEHCAKLYLEQWDETFG